MVTTPSPNKMFLSTPTVGVVRLSESDTSTTWRSSHTLATSWAPHTVGTPLLRPVARERVAFPPPRSHYSPNPKRKKRPTPSTPPMWPYRRPFARPNLYKLGNPTDNLFFGPMTSISWLLEAVVFGNRRYRPSSQRKSNQFFFFYCLRIGHMSSYCSESVYGSHEYHVTRACLVRTLGVSGPNIDPLIFLKSPQWRQSDNATIWSTPRHVTPQGSSPQTPHCPRRQWVLHEEH